LSSVVLTAVVTVTAYCPPKYSEDAGVTVNVFPSALSEALALPEVTAGAVPMFVKVVLINKPLESITVSFLTALLNLISTVLALMALSSASVKNKKSPGNL
jgi:hypothetical protein